MTSTTTRLENTLYHLATATPHTFIRHNVLYLCSCRVDCISWTRTSDLARFNSTDVCPQIKLFTRKLSSWKCWAWKYNYVNFIGFKISIITKLHYVLFFFCFFQDCLLIPGPGHKVIKLFLCSAQLRLKFILLINIKMPTF